MAENLDAGGIKGHLSSLVFFFLVYSLFCHLCWASFLMFFLAALALAESVTECPVTTISEFWKERVTLETGDPFSDVWTNKNK